MKPAASCSLRLLALVVLALAAAVGARAQAPNIYVTQSGSASGACVTGVQTPTFFNTTANWGTGAGQIGPGTRVTICGTITSTLSFQGSGTSGHPVTLFFDTGANISQAFCGAGGGSSCLDLAGKQWIVIDGAVPCGVISYHALYPESTCNGIIQATANGTVLANHNGTSSGITAGSSCNVEIKNIDLRNIYVRTSTTDIVNDPSGLERPWGVDIGNNACNISIHDSKFHDANWMLTSIQCSGSGSAGLTFYNNDIYNMNHGIAVGVCTNSNSGTVIHHNHLGSMVNWDDTTGQNNYHHDPIHFYTAVQSNQVSGSITGASIYSNWFDGNLGITNTGHIFFEGPITANIFNNVFFVPLGIRVNNGTFDNVNSLGSATNVKNIGFWNNTLIYQTTDTGQPINLVGTVDMRNNAVTLAQTNNPGLVAYSGTGLIDFNAYADPIPGSQLFSAISTCCQWTYATWQGAGHLNDVHSMAIQAPTMGISTTDGTLSSTSPLINTGTNLTSLGIAEA
jgi:hypothetical protein